MVLGGEPRGARPPSRTAYYIALAGVLTLLLLLCCYFIYFCVRRVKELARNGLPEPVQSVRPPPPGTIAYPVQPVVRASASAMARLCHSPASPRARLLSPSSERASSAKRSTSLTPRPDLVHPRAAPNALPPPTILTPRTTPIRNAPISKPGRLELRSPAMPHRAVANGPKCPRSPKKSLPRVTNSPSPKRRRERAPSEECSPRKHLSAPPDIVVGEIE